MINEAGYSKNRLHHWGAPALIKKILDGSVKQQAIDDYGKLWDEYWTRLLLETVRGRSQS